MTESKYFDKGDWNIYSGYENNCLKVNNKYYISGAVTKPTGDNTNPVDSSYIYMNVLSESFDSLNTFTYLHDTLIIWVSGMCQTKDKGFLVVGQARRRDNGALVYENSSDAFMLKIDSLGQEVWYKTFGRNTSSHDQDEFMKVVQTPDKGYLCAGYTKSWQTQNFFDKGDWWLVKTDSLGEELWSRRYGHPDYNDARPYTLLMSSDTSYYLVGNHVMYQVNGNNARKAHILKLDKDFNEVYQKDFEGVSMDNSFYDIIENNEGDLILTSYFQDAYALYGERAMMYKLTADGDSIWRRQYTCHDTLNSINRAYSIKQTSDDGYIFTGIAYDNELSPAQQVWLVKTDQYGCDGTTEFWDCATNIGVNEYVSNPDFSVFPNPVAKGNNVQLTISNKQLSSLRGGTTKQSVEIYNLTGKLVKQMVRLSGDEASKGTVFSVDLSNLESGIYIVKVGDKMQKLIVE